MILLAFLCGASGSLPAAQNLADKSPFLPPNYSANDNSRQKDQPKKEEEEIKFMGVYNVGEIWYFYLYSIKEDKGYWVRINDRSAHFYVKSFNQAQNSIMVEINNMVKEIKLNIMGFIWKDSFQFSTFSYYRFLIMGKAQVCFWCLEFFF